MGSVAMTDEEAFDNTEAVRQSISCSVIDVGLIVYNERAILAPTIDALISAGFESFIVLDMQSTDGTFEYLTERLGSKARINQFPRRSLLEYGYAEARNVCAAYSTREWLLFVDADEVLLSGASNGSVHITSCGDNSEILSIERRNLERDFRDGAGGVKSPSGKKLNPRNRL